MNAATCALIILAVPLFADQDVRATHRGPTNAVISGLWYNQHGSELYLEQSSHGQLKGEFRTAVELRCGSAGDSHAKVHGHMHGHLFHFAFYSKGSNALISFSGQHFVNCTHPHVVKPDGEMLHASWVLSNTEECCIDSWKQNRFGQDILVRLQPKDGGRKDRGIHAPSRPEDCGGGEYKRM